MYVRTYVPIFMTLISCFKSSSFVVSYELLPEGVSNPKKSSADTVIACPSFKVRREGDRHVCGVEFPEEGHFCGRKARRRDRVNGAGLLSSQSYVRGTKHSIIMCIQNLTQVCKLSCNLGMEA